VPASGAVRRSATRVTIGVAINVLVAALHLIDLRARLRTELRPLIGSYFSDVALPFAFYFLLCFVDDQMPRLRPTVTKAGVVFFAAAQAQSSRGALA
jgi:hypothetical protein